jgi:hypothetical protein
MMCDCQGAVFSEADIMQKALLNEVEQPTVTVDGPTRRGEEDEKRQSRFTALSDLVL